MLRLVTVDNPSGAPYTLVPPHFPATLTACSPTQVYERLRHGACDAALLPVARLAEMRDRVEPLGAYGIACTGTVYSVVLFSRIPVHAAVSEGRPIYVTPSSQTSRQLLRFLCHREFGRSPVLTDRLEDTDVRLLIGDEALEERRPEYQWAVLRDMGDWWFEQTGLPFVFARWVVRRDLPEEHATAIGAWLSANASRANSPQGRECLARAGLASLRSEAFARMYYRRIHAHLTLDDLRGLDTFLAIQKEHRQCCQVA